MSFKPIRTFLTDRLKEIDSDFTPFENGFDSGQIGSDNFDKRFHIFYGNVTTTASNQNTTTDSVAASVTLYFSGSRNSMDELDEAMDIANAYRINCLRRIKYANQTFIKNVVSQNIEALPLESNDNAIQIKLTFNVSVIFGTGLDLNC
jgi:hypothetical protein